MNKHKLIDFYRLATSPFRRWRLKSMINTGTVPVSVVFYHRVDNQHLNDWTITESRFLEQINWYQENFDLVSLEEAQKRIDSGFNDRPTLSITFDDGYADNCSFALPLLIERQIPFTYFVTTLHTLGQEAFPHDKAEGLPLPTNTKESLIALAAAGVEIGAHTRTHPDLGKLSDPQQLFDEVITATRELEEAIGKDIKYFAFPFGQVENLNSDVFRLCKEHGFKGVCSAYGGLNFVGDESFHLQRMHGDPKISRMKNWLTYDTRVLNKQRFQYDGKPNNTAQDSQTQQNPATPLNIEPQT